MALDDLDDDCWLFLHDVRLRGVVEVGDESVVLRVVEAGLAERGRKGTQLTKIGHARHAAWARLDPGGEVEAAIERSYQRFLKLNRELIRVCNDWQVRSGGVANDHRDPGYDWGIVDRLIVIDDRVSPILSSSSERVARFGGYRPRLRQARERVTEGEHDWFTSPRIDSYHTVWMQLHEDLLLALGLERASEK